MQTKFMKPDACRGCPAFEYGVGFVPPTPDNGAEFAFVGQGPGEQEARWGSPFQPKAPAGAKLRGWVAKAGIANAWYGNVVCCWLPELSPAARARVPSNRWGSREPTEVEANYCWPRHTGPALHGMMHLRHTFAVGATAARWLLRLPWHKGVERWIGTTTEVELR